MQEKILVKSERYEIEKKLKRLLIIGIILTVMVWCILTIATSLSQLDFDFYENCYDKYLEHQAEGCCSIISRCFSCELIVDYPTKADYALRYYIGYWPLWPFLIAIGGLFLVYGVIYLWLRSYELTVTDKRVYGKVAWGKRVDLPIDAVSATGYLQGWKGVTISTASGRLSFRVIKNAEKIYSVVNELLIERQSAKASGVSGATPQPSDSADQLKKYKDLLDAGVITQEEFDAKKKQILDL